MRRSATVVFVILFAAATAILFLLLPVLLSPSPTGMQQEAPPIATPPETGESASTAESVAKRPYRAIWISYLEWETVDFSSAAAFTADVSAMLDNCTALGITVVIAHVRPFGDALYPSELYPFSHLCTGTQGVSPGFDPLAILVEQAHDRGLELEAWVNPYRLQAGGVPQSLSPDGIAAQHPDWVRSVNDGLWLCPALPEVQQYVADGVRELCQKYEIDGIHFDDYFYPTTDSSFDGAEYEAYRNSGGTLTLDDWRRDNVSALVRLCYQAAHSCGVRFGIAPQASLENNRNVQYSDIDLWLREPGYLDYLMPQFYWGLEYQHNGSTEMALADCLTAWLALPRDDSVSLYAGLGAYRIGEGDGNTASSSREWQSGTALAGQVSYLRQQGIGGIGLYRYASLFDNPEWNSLAIREQQALKALWVEE